MTYFLICLIGFSLICDCLVLYIKEDTKGSKIYFYISSWVWYSLTIFLLILSIVKSEMGMWYIPEGIPLIFFLVVCLIVYIGILIKKLKLFNEKEDTTQQ